jgi:hypothetical protein
MLAGDFVANNSTNITSLESDSFGRMNTKSLGTFIVFAILTSAFSLFGGLTNVVLMVVLIKYVPVVKKIYVYMISLSLSNVLYNFLWQHRRRQPAVHSAVCPRQRSSSRASPVFSWPRWISTYSFAFLLSMLLAYRRVKPS